MEVADAAIATAIVVTLIEGGGGSNDNQQLLWRQQWQRSEIHENDNDCNDGSCGGRGLEQMRQQ